MYPTTTSASRMFSSQKSASLSRSLEEAVQNHNHYEVAMILQRATLSLPTGKIPDLQHSLKRAIDFASGTGDDKALQLLLGASDTILDSSPPSPVLSQTLSRNSAKSSWSSLSSLVPHSRSPLGSFAISFDIDGVLLRGPKALPHATQTLSFLNKHNIPFIFLTNSGGRTEKERIKHLREVFSVEVLHVNQFVQSHTPVKNFLPQYGNESILVVGGVGDECRLVAESYGFKSVVTTADLIVACPQIWPFNQINPGYYKSFARPLPAPINHDNPAKPLAIKAIFVFNSSRDWGLDSQIIIDLLRSHHGVIGTIDPGEEVGIWQQTAPPLVFCNPDFVWSTSWHRARFGQGAHKAALRGIWAEITGGAAELKFTEMGKPAETTFRYGEKVLEEWRRELLHGSDEELPKLKRVWHIGDSTDSDVQGAMQYKSPDDIEWQAVLVETGIYLQGEKPKFEPTVTVPNVRDAINWVLKVEEWNEEVEDNDEEKEDEEEGGDGVVFG